jgi:hypothetical protein
MKQKGLGKKQSRPSDFQYELRKTTKEMRQGNL